MTAEKLRNDTQTLHRFIQLHCDKEHSDVPQKEGILQVAFEEKSLCDIPYKLCEECETLMLYGYDRLRQCPHQDKPSCRKCPNPCYEKPMWKKMARIMMYSGMRLGLTKVRKLLFR